LARWHLHRGLASLPGYRMQRVSSLEALPGLDLDRLCAIVLYFHQKTISATALDALDRYVQGGGGILAVHSATASFKQTDRFFEILGGRFREHGPVEEFEVQPVGGQAGTFGDIPTFAIRDELYLHDYDPEIVVHFQTAVDQRQEPVVWTRHHGAGRVCYAVPGHTSASIRQPQVQAILRRGLRWVCGDLPEEGHT
jgi:type 1 glutamine amidotransferase